MIGESNSELKPLTNGKINQINQQILIPITANTTFLLKLQKQIIYNTFFKYLLLKFLQNF